ncbi:tyrosine--tRNA ligase, mitochondrial [Galendromus occidentalis]|uniref:Tyrosine--tRNA ligase n=1 Tax=Galendromus occidentalis TaxID=34638 RepID=A0AAJ6QME8_9ACAR|nr:tyrosine--tRNA ligase, mitochondrial [Galendromus occidentalis]
MQSIIRREALSGVCKLYRWSYCMRNHWLWRRHLHKMRSRGFIQQIYPPVEESRLPQVLKDTRAAYCGFDPTSDSLHLGNLLSILVLIQLQKRGVIPIAVVGEATAQIGDPSGRSTERESLSSVSLHQNVRGLEQNLRTVFSNHERFFHKSGDLPQLVLLRNSAWYSGLEVINFLKTTGRYFRISLMLSREAVKSRLASSEGMSVSEFSYQIFQAFDWLQLYKQYGCGIQVGGQDQLGNIDAGHDLIRKALGKNSVGLLTPIITAESGSKYGKSAGNAVWLSGEKTSPYELFQFLLRMSDTEAVKMVPVFSFTGDEELVELLEQHNKHPEQRPLQTRIANDITLLLHGPEGLELAQKATALLFDGRGDLLNEMDEKTLRKLFLDTAYAEISRVKLSEKYSLVEFSLEAKLFKKESDAKRIIAAGGLYINMIRTTSEFLSESCVLSSGLTLCRTGKKNYTLVKWI